MPTPTSTSKTPNDNTPQPHLFTIVVEHEPTLDVSKLSSTVRDVVQALPDVHRVGILYPDGERNIGINTGRSPDLKVMP